MSYDTIITAEAAGEVTVKKSRFIAAICPVQSEQEATEYIKAKKKQYHDARHNCSCYIVGKGDIEKSSDDGEPSGTAGRPMLEVIKGQGLYNVVCVVTRYFGGVLLGTGGLVRAYSDAVKEALSVSELCQTFSVEVIEVVSDYNNWPKIEQLARVESLLVGDTDYMENVKAKIEIPIDSVEPVIEKITDLTNAKAKITRLETKEALRIT
ncbi:MAG: YigZ family protein [Lachnospiraceae bacterium]|nr:YigZ family protein [Lachnospiraceae bacterium]